MIRIIKGDCRERLRDLPDESVHCVVTSPPYFGLRDYGVVGQLGLEQTPHEYVEQLVSVFREVRPVLRKDGTVWLNLGDSYNGRGKGQFSNGESNPKKNRTRGMKLGASRIDGLKPKDLIGIPWLVAFALQADGWWLRQDIIWAKPNPMPESVTDRCTKAHEYIFLLTKSARYFYDAEAIADPGTGRETFFPGPKLKSLTKTGFRNDGESANFSPALTRNKRSVWTVAAQPFSGAHFATFPPDLIEPCVKAGCPKDGTVLDPFAGAGTTGLVADRLGRDAILIELNPNYADMTERRIADDAGMFAQMAAE